MGENNDLFWKQESHGEELGWLALVSYHLHCGLHLHMGTRPKAHFCLLGYVGRVVSCIIHGMGFPLNKNFLYEKKERGCGKVETQKLTPTSFTSHLKGRLTEWVSRVWMFSSESHLCCWSSVLGTSQCYICLFLHLHGHLVSNSDISEYRGVVILSCSYSSLEKYTQWWSQHRQ